LCGLLQNEFSRDENGVVTNNDVDSFIESLRTLREQTSSNPRSYKRHFEPPFYKCLLGIGKRKAGKERTIEYMICDWANMRYWAIDRNIRGLMYIREAFEVYALICFDRTSQKTIDRMAEMGETNYERFIEKIVDAKYQPLISPRGGDPDKAKEFLDEYQKLECVSYKAVQTTGTDVTSRIIVRPYGRQNGRPVAWSQPQYTVMAPAYKVNSKDFKDGNLKAGKPESQNIFIPHIRGRRSLFFDSNSATSFEDAIKIPMALSEFHQDPSLKFVNYPETIFTRRHNWKAEAYGVGDHTWVTSGKEFWAVSAL